MTDLCGFRVAVIATDGFEESELTEPVAALKDAGAEVMIASLNPGEIQGFVHDVMSVRVKVHRKIEELDPDDFDGVQLPGGCLNADALPGNRRATTLRTVAVTRAFPTV